MKFEEKVVLLVLLHKKLENTKMKLKFWVETLPHSRRERGIFTPYLMTRSLFHRITG
jgi:hypothetical protein